MLRRRPARSPAGSPGRGVEIGRAGFGELHDRERGNRLGVRADPERCVSSRLVAVAVVAEASRVNHGAVVDDRHRDAGEGDLAEPADDQEQRCEHDGD